MQFKELMSAELILNWNEWWWMMAEGKKEWKGEIACVCFAIFPKYQLYKIWLWYQDCSGGMSNVFLGQIMSAHVCDLELLGPRINIGLPMTRSRVKSSEFRHARTQDASRTHSEVARDTRSFFSWVNANASWATVNGHLFSRQASEFHGEPKIFLTWLIRRFCHWRHMSATGDTCGHILMPGVNRWTLSCSLVIGSLQTRVNASYDRGPEGEKKICFSSFVQQRKVIPYKVNKPQYKFFN